MDYEQRKKQSRREIALLMADRRERTSREIAERFKATPQYIAKRLGELQDMGLVTSARFGNGNQAWRATYDS